MKLCLVSDRTLQQLADGLLSGSRARRLEQHMGRCSRCAARYAVHCRLQAALTREAQAPLLAVADVEAMVDTALRRYGNAALPAMALRLPRVRVALAFATLCLVAGGALWLAMQRQQRHEVATAPVSRMLDAGRRDSSFAVGSVCMVHLAAGSSARLLVQGARSARFALEHGLLLVASHAGCYDTLSVSCGAITLYARGTRFAVERNADSVHVWLVEGELAVHARSGDSTVLQQGQEWSFSPGPAGLASAATLRDSARLALLERFAPMEQDLSLLADETPWRRPQARPATPSRPSPGEAETQYEVIDHMIAEGRYSEARHVIDYYLRRFALHRDRALFDRGYCCTRLRRFDEAARSYGEAAAASADTVLIETAAHRVNKINTVLRHCYADAAGGIRAYLARYGRGRWREEELALLVTCRAALGERDSAQVALARLRSEFPRSCQLSEAAAQLQGAAPPAPRR
jgi:ferric-dicitrate binding protein FerR (iron transport regulator)